MWGTGSAQGGRSGEPRAARAEDAGENSVAEVDLAYLSGACHSFCDTRMARFFYLSPASVSAKFLHVPVTLRIQKLCGSIVKEQITGQYDRVGRHQWQW